MAKRIRWSNNERVDVPDLQAATSGGDTAATPGFAEAEARRLTVETVLTKYPAVLEGFRIEVPDQATNPGEFIVHNAFAYDRAGRILNDESEPDATKSYTLPNPNTQYFVEAEVLMVASDVDARAFWDQTYDNGTQPSGDPQQPGREFALNVSTRMTPQWQIVMPPSVTGFDIDTNPNSTRIPIATLETNGLTQITNITKSFTAQSVLAEDYAAGANSIRVHNTRIFPDTFTLDIIQLLPTPVTESIAVTANDRVNGILTLGAPTANNHFAGQRVRDSSVGAPLFIGENYQPSVVPSSDSKDARPRLFAADEQAGFVALRSPEVSAGYTDTQIATMRDEINALAASVREMRWGGFLDSDSSSIMPTRIGQYAQANSFSTSPRWFEPAGGIQGAKTCTVSVGDGVLSFGDYNANAYPSDADAIQAAINKIAESGATGGTLYIKRTDAFYGMNTVTPATVSIPAFTKGLTIVGDGDMTELRMNIEQPFFTLAAGAVVHFENLAITRAPAGAKEPAILAGNNATITARNLKADGIKTAGGLGANVLNVDLENCIISSSGSHTDSIAMLGRVTGVAKNCSFLSFISDAASRAIRMGANSYLKTHDCRFLTTGVAPVAIVEASSSAIYSATGCLFSHSGIPAGLAGVLVSAGAAQINLDKCIMVAAGSYSFVDATNVTKLIVSGCSMTYPANSSAVKFSGGSATIQNCQFTQTSAGSSGSAIYFNGGENVDISDVLINDADYGIVASSGSVNSLRIRGARIHNAILGAGMAGIVVTPSNIYECSISDCEISGLDSNAAPALTNYGIRVLPGSTGENISIRSNLITGMVGTDFAYGIEVAGPAKGVSISDNMIGGAPGLVTSNSGTVGIRIIDNGIAAPTDVSIIGNKLVNLDGSVDARGIDISAYNGLSVANNSIKGIGSAVSSGNADGIRFGWNAAAVPAYQENATITGNTIRLVECSGVGATVATGINGAVGADRVVVANNTIADCKNTANPSGAGGKGIWMSAANIGGAYIRSLAINGNVIVPTPGGAQSFTDCINVDGLNTSDEGDITINGNTLRHFSGSGIRVFPVLGDELYNLTISGNTARTDIQCVAIVAVGKVIGFSITGNTLVATLGGSLSQNGIWMAEAGTTSGTIGMNLIKVNDPGVNTYGIKFMGYAASIVGNFIWTGNFANANTQSIYLGQAGNAYCLIMANQLQTGVSGGPTTFVFPAGSVTAGAYAPGATNAFQAVSDLNNRISGYNINAVTDAP